MKIGFIPILSVGLAISASILSYTYFLHYAPDMELAQATEDYAHQLQTEAQKLPQANKRRIDASNAVNQANADWNKILLTHAVPPSLAAGGINLGVHAWQLVIDVRTFRNNMQRAVNRQVKAGGVLVNNGPLVPQPGTEATTVLTDYFNYPAIPFPVVIFDFGQISVEGTFDQIKTNMESWSNMPNYLAVADGLTLTGTAPRLTGTYNLSILGYIQGSVVYPTVRETAAPAVTSPAGGGGGGAPAGGGGGFAPGGGGGGAPAGGGGGGSAATGGRRLRGPVSAGG